MNASRFCLAPSGLVEPLFCRGEAMIARRFSFVNSEYTSYMQTKKRMAEGGNLAAFG
jgi:hypothetical protein